MKINRFMTLTAIALLVVGAMGAMATRSFALGLHAPVAQVSGQATTCAQDLASGTEVNSPADTGTIGLQCGDQTTVDSGTAAAGVETVGSAETSATAETANESLPSDGPNGPAVQLEQSGQSDGQFGQ